MATRIHRFGVLTLAVSALIMAPVTAARAQAQPPSGTTPTAPPTAADPAALALPAAIPEPAEIPAVRSPAPSGYVSSYASHDVRYDDTIVGIDAYKALGSPNARIRPYVSASIVRDSRTSAGTITAPPAAFKRRVKVRAPVPLIFSDNYATLDAGLQFTTAAGLRVFAQGGFAATVGPVAALPSHTDARGGLQLYREWGALNAAHRTSGNFSGSVTYLSRYSDGVLSLQLEEIRNIGTAGHPLEAFARGFVTGDTRTLYYSNVVEGTIGLRLRPLGPGGPAFSLEQVAGRYVRGALRPANVGKTYTDFRPTVSFDYAL